MNGKKIIIGCWITLSISAFFIIIYILAASNKFPNLFSELSDVAFRITDLVSILLGLDYTKIPIGLKILAMGLYWIWFVLGIEYVFRRKTPSVLNRRFSTALFYLTAMCTLSYPLIYILAGRANLTEDILHPSLKMGFAAGVMVFLGFHHKKFSSLKCRGAFLLGLPLVLALSVAVCVAAFLATTQRTQVIAKFNPDEIITNSFFQSIYETPKEFQFYLHAAALKDCKPYAWSYSKMDFYLLRESIAHNVVPRDWIEKCRTYNIEK